jgi:hypothetical protein
VKTEFNEDPKKGARSSTLLGRIRFVGGGRSNVRVELHTGNYGIRKLCIRTNEYDRDGYVVGKAHITLDPLVASALISILQQLPEAASDGDGRISLHLGDESRDRAAAVAKLHAQGLSIRQIVEQLDMGYTSVSKYVQDAEAARRTAKSSPTASQPPTVQQSGQGQTVEQLTLTAGIESLQ